MTTVDDIEQWVRASGAAVTVRSGAGDPTVVHERAVDEAALAKDWAIGRSAGIEELTGTAAAVAAAFPLVEATVTKSANGATVELSARVYLDGLSRQAFELTASAVTRAAAALDAASELRRLLRADSERSRAANQTVHDEVAGLVAQFDAEVAAITHVKAPVAAPVRPSAAPAASVAAASSTDGELYDLVLLDAGPAKIDVIKSIKAGLQIELADAKDLVDSAPSTLLAGRAFADADVIGRSLQSQGAVVEVRPHA